MPENRSKSRPFGVIVVILLQLFSVISLLTDIYFATSDFSVFSIINTPQAVLLPLPAVFVAVGYQLIVIIGLWLLKRWAWFLFMIQLGVSMATQLLLYIQGTPLYIYMFISVVTVFYMNQRDVQKAFERVYQPQGAA